METITVDLLKAPLCKHTSNRPELQGFLDRYYEEVYQHPFCRFIQHWKRNDAVYFEIQPFDGKISLSFIGVVVEERRKGYGTEALRWLCDIADESDATLSLTIEPEKGSGVNKTILKAWYQKLGFKKSPYGRWIRTPQGKE